MVRLVVCWILMRDHILAKGVRGVGYERGRVAIAANELCRLREREIQNVVEDEHLAVAVRASADADSRSGDLGRDHVGDFAWNAFENQKGYARAIKSDGIAHKLFDLG